MGTASYDGTRYANPFVDALVDGARWKSGNTVTYYLDGNWQQYGASAAIQAAAASWNAVANIHYVLSTSKSGADYVESLYSDTSRNDDGTVTLGEHYLPNNQHLGGKYNTGSGYFNASDIAKGGFFYETFIHELGHGIGLDHPFDGDQVFPGVTTGDSTDTGDHDLNSELYTVMTYNDVSDASGDPGTSAYGYAETPMAFDIAAAQAIYGANMSTATGNDTYVLPEAGGAGTGYTCIWDAGGTDTISAARRQVDCTIDLRAATLDDAPGGGGELSSESGTFGGVTIAHGVTIENALGGLMNDTIIGNDANNRLDGGTGHDVITTGGGNDTIVLEGAEYLKVTDFQDGKDSFDLSGLANLDLFAIYGTTQYDGTEVEFVSRYGGDAAYVLSVAPLNGTEFGTMPVTWNLKGVQTFTGGVADDRLTGTAANDTLHGGAGNDVLDGSAGNDVLYGGTGDDTYVVGTAKDLVFEDRNAGYDTVRSSATYTLGANAEALILIGTDAISGTGNELANALTGNDAANSLFGMAGNDTLDGARGDDTLFGGDGNDLLGGGPGRDTMRGGAGDDTYLVGNVHDLVFEDANAGTDTVKASVSYTLGYNTENLTLTGADAINATGNSLANVLTGNDAANTLSGSSGDDTLLGGGGNDLLSGGPGHDTMRGGTGDDTYLVGNVHDLVFEDSNAGTDTIQSSVSYTLGLNTENLTLTGTDATSAHGNTLANVLTGNAAANQLFGMDGNDTLVGGLGRDVLTGGAGADHFVFASAADFASATGASADEITDFATGDRIDVSAIDAVPGGGNSAFRWIGTAAFDSHAGELRTFQQAGATYVEGDIDGNGKADFALKLDGSHALTAADFVL